MKNAFVISFFVACIFLWSAVARLGHDLLFPGRAEEQREVAKLQCQLHMDFPFNPDMSCSHRLAFQFLED